MAYPLGLSGFVTMCMVREHISTVYKVTASMTEELYKSLQNRRINTGCTARPFSSPQNFFVSGRDLKMVHKVVSECLLAGLSS